MAGAARQAVRGLGGLLLRQSATLSAATGSGRNDLYLLQGLGRQLQSLAWKEASTSWLSTNTTCVNARSYGTVVDSAKIETPLIQYAPGQAFVGHPAPDFKAPAVVDGEIKTVSLSDYKGKYVVLFFYPKDFTFVCPTEIIAFSDRAKEFAALNTQVIAASTDTEECHLAWIKTPRNKGGLGYMQIPIVADTTKEIATKYGVLVQKAGIALRGLFIINPEGVIQQVTINDLPIGRSVDETLRLVQAIQFHAEHGEVCPADWKPGAKTIVADPEKSQEYFSSLKEAQEGEDVDSRLTPIEDRKQFDEVVGRGKTVLYFMAPWCGKCKMIKPLVHDLAGRHSDFTFAKLDTTNERIGEVVEQLGVKALPAFRFFKDGKEVGSQVVGYKKKPLEDGVAALASS